MSKIYLKENLDKKYGKGSLHERAVAEFIDPLLKRLNSEPKLTTHYISGSSNTLYTNVINWSSLENNEIYEIDAVYKSSGGEFISLSRGILVRLNNMFRLFTILDANRDKMRLEVASSGSLQVVTSHQYSGVIYLMVRSIIY